MGWGVSMEWKPSSFWSNLSTIPCIVFVYVMTSCRAGRNQQTHPHGAAQTKVWPAQETSQSDSSSKVFQNGSKTSLTTYLLESHWNSLGLEREISEAFLAINTLVPYPEAGLHLSSSFKWLFYKIITWHFWIKHRHFNPASFPMNKQISLIKYVVSFNYSGYFK